MIKTTNLNKYFNKGKSNSIHVINNTSIEFPQKGLVSLVGQSGSGKTTLLNVISGLDKATGTIEFDNVKMKKYSSSKWDKIRAHDVGYIFQNYYLLENKTVYENIATTLTMIGIVDKEELDYRIEYVLRAVNMFRYRRKKASDLSGGQKQRVAIARALAKNPKVVIADEPTGNLDSKNSIEVMKIIKNISEERLVVLVTHNTELANKYSDSIVSLADGKVISQEVNTLSDETKINYTDNNIYLQDFVNHESINQGVKVYTQNKEDIVDLTIIKIDNVYYLKSENQNIRLNIVTPQSGIELINSKREESIHVSEQKSNFSLDGLEKVKSKRVKKRTLSLKEAVIESFKKIRKTGVKSKLFVFSLVLLGVLISSMGHLFLSTLIFDDSIIYTDKNVYVMNGEVDYFNSSLLPSDDYYAFEDLKLTFAPKSSFSYRQMSFEHVLPIDTLNRLEKDFYGRMPESMFEVVIDSSILDSNYNNSVIFNSHDIYNVRDLVGSKITIRTSGGVNGYLDLVIVGTTNTNNKSIYLTNDLIYNLKNSEIEYRTIFYNNVNDELNIRDGIMSTSTVHHIAGVDVIEVVAANPTNLFVLTDPSDITTSAAVYEFHDLHFIVTGFVDHLETNPRLTMVYLPGTMYETSVGQYYTKLLNSGNFALYSLTDNFDVNGFVNSRKVTINRLKESLKDSNRVIIIQSLIALGVSALVFFFLVRSSITSRVKEISILRSLGISKGEVITLFSVEYTMLTLFTSMVGVIIGGITMNAVGNSFLSEIFKIRVTPLSTIFGIVLIFFVNVVIGLIPVFTLLRKTPAQMLTNYDI